MLACPQATTPAQVHCVQAYGRLLAILQELGPFPAKLVLHSWAGSPDISHQLAAIDGVYFSVSGHITRLKPAKARATVAAVRAVTWRCPLLPSRSLPLMSHAALHGAIIRWHAISENCNSPRVKGSRLGPFAP